MIETNAAGDPYQLGHNDRRDNEAPGHGAGGPASRRIVTAYGFWIFLLSDIVVFSGFFAAYAVLEGERAGGPGPRDLFDIDRVVWETTCLLLSSFTCGLAALANARRDMTRTQLLLLVTGLLGFAFVALEVTEFWGLIARGDGPRRSAFLSAFFALVGLHGLHVSAGLLWIGTSMAMLRFRGFRPDLDRLLMCFSLFWHALDIVWVAIFTMVYLIGVET